MTNYIILHLLIGFCIGALINWKYGGNPEYNIYHMSTSAKVVCMIALIVIWPISLIIMLIDKYKDRK